MELYKSIFTTGLPRLMLPLFPLKLAVLPKEVLPLHIFEDRYKEMIAECISSDSLFGMIYREKGEFSKIGCAVKVYKTLNKYEDGKYDILIKGCYRFKIINYMKKNNLWYGDIKEIDEHYDLMDPKIFNYILDKYLKVLLSNNANQNIQDELNKSISFDFTKNLIIPTQIKQEFLELDDEFSRMKYIEKFLDTILNSDNNTMNLSIKDKILN
ncbi:MAG: hypothetical protein CBE33_02830 [Candidatus Pelagibacter sp. TMED273]|nr:MAG: hypothetical protein CBE33_02830 [Candidatus Pelagibacter sp. TMED273]